ncbi:MAG: hypothetical protein E8D47_08575 [Nitrospira sp.]|nr:MAG: hypothetical protein E8D47_08575 [Nitrospira sp.]
MNNFEYRDGELYCEQVPVSRISKEVGTPCYVYSYETLIRHYRAYDGAFKSVPHVIAFAMKANSNIAILRLMAKEGSGVDIVSGGELFRALKAGVPPSKIPEVLIKGGEIHIIKTRETYDDLIKGESIPAFLD